MSDVEQWEHDEQRAMENEIISLREQVEKLTAALKLSREALSDVMEWCICQDSNFYKPCEEALAAIDATTQEDKP